MIDKIIHEINNISLDKKQEDILGLKFGVDKVRLNKLLKNGWWHVLFFAQDEYRSYGLRVIPDLSWENWPVVQNINQNRCITYAPNLSSFIFFRTFYLCNNRIEFAENLKDNLKDIISSLEKISDIFNSKTEQFAKIITDLNIQKKEPWKADKNNRYKKIWLAFEGSGATFNFFNTISNMIIDESFLPAPNAINDTSSFGIWESRASTMFAERYASLSYMLDLKEYQTIVWKGFVENFGYDAHNISFEFLPDESYEPYMNGYDFALLLNPTIEEIIPEIINDPMFPAVISLINEKSSQYRGVDHFEAAAILDEKFNLPIRAWKALMGASYWSAKNLKEGFPQSIEAAIYLSKENSWEDALTALNYQKSFAKF